MAAGGPDLNPARIMDENELLRKNVGPLRSGGGGGLGLCRDGHWAL